MPNYKRYPKYKESGIAWLGEVPEGWEQKKLKYFARIKNGQDQKKVITENGKYPIYGSGGEFGRANSYLYNKVSVLLGRKGTLTLCILQKSIILQIQSFFITLA